MPGMLFLYNHNVNKRRNGEKDLEIDKQAKALLHSCFMLTNCTETGLPAEVTKVSDIQGMSVIDKQKMYLLRPEIIESYYYLKETEGDPIGQYYPL